MMMHKNVAVLGLAIGVGACAAIPPSGPGVMVLPGSNSNFSQFRADDMDCQQYARQAIGQRTPGQAAADSAVNSASAGAALGAAAGAIIGAASGDPGAGAALGAGTGLLVGGASGADAYGVAAYEMQDRYDMAYVQCMYSYGHQVPVPAGMGALSSRPATNTPPPSPRTPPPPPPRR